MESEIPIVFVEPDCTCINCESVFRNPLRAISRVKIGAKFMPGVDKNTLARMHDGFPNLRSRDWLLSCHASRS